MKKIIFSPQAPTPIGPYSQAVRIGDLLFVSGQIALDSEGNLHTENIEIETTTVMNNIGNILKAAGLGFEHVVKSTIFVRNLDNFSAINEVYGRYFASEPPARETVEVSCLPKNVNVEISCIAYFGN